MTLKKTTYRIKTTSKKQAKKNREIAKIKASLPPVCEVCKCRETKDPAHLLPRSTFPEYYSEAWNIAGMCRTCHDKYDNDLGFRQKQTKLYQRVKANAGEQPAYRYFKM